MTGFSSMINSLNRYASALLVQFLTNSYDNTSWLKTEQLVAGLDLLPKKVCQHRVENLQKKKKKCCYYNKRSTRRLPTYERDFASNFQLLI